MASSAPEDSRSLGNQAIALGANAILGGITAGVRQKHRGSSFWSAFVRGAIGGAVTHAGKRVAGEQFEGAGFLGREVAAVGSSMVLNASEGRGLLERVVLPVGPVRLYLDRSAPRPLSARVDLAAAVVSAYVATQSSSLDWRSSLSAGAPVFIMGERSQARGLHTAGVIQLRADAADEMAEALAHEQVHVAQHDFAFIALVSPMERALLNRSSAGARVARHLDLGLHVLVLGSLNRIVPYEHQPWEWEAHVLSDTQAMYW